MSSLISCATGDWTAASTWALVDATSLLDSEAGNTALTTSYVESASFTPGAITIDGIAVKLASRAASPSGTISVRLAQAGVTVPGTEVTLNVSDLPTCDTTQNEGGWILFKFAAPVTLTAATAYTVSAKTSAASQVNLYRNGTAGNWSRMLRTTTTQAPVAGDVLHVLGEHTGAGTGNDLIVTMDSTVNTDYGTGVDGSVALTVCKRGTLNYAFAAATNYYLKLSGNCIVYNGGTFTIGTVANPIPRDSTAVLEFDPVADGGMGLLCRNGSTFTAQGLSRTAGKNVYYCRLNTNEAIGQTVLGVDTDTGWLAGDAIGIASTTKTYSQCERRTLAINASATELTITAGLTYAHSGTSPTQAEVILLTRNVKIRSATSTIMAYTVYKLTATVDIDWAEFYYLGEAATDKYPISIQTTTGSFSIQYCSLHDCEDYGFCIYGLTANNFNISYNVTYSVTTTGGHVLQISSTSGTSYTISGNILMYCPYSSGWGLYLLDVGGTITNNVIVGMASYGIYLYEAALMSTFSGNLVHSCDFYGVYLYAAPSAGSTISNLTVWRCGSNGIYANSSLASITFDTITLFGNPSGNCRFVFTTSFLTFRNVVANGEAAYPTSYGILFSSDATNILFENCQFGGTTAHTGADISVPANVTMELQNTLLASGTEIGNAASMLPRSYIVSQKHDQTAGLHRAWLPNGRATGSLDVDNTYFHTAAPSLRMSPGSATLKLESAASGRGKKAAVNNGGTATFSVWVRKSSVAAGGADYNGNQPRLVLKKNIGAGIASDTVLDTMTVGLDTWEQLSSTTPAVTDDAVLEVVVDCDGTTGFLNVDDWSVS
jgi:hypothetical protein